MKLKYLGPPPGTCNKTLLVYCRRSVRPIWKFY